jgi:hypothetical protein
MEAAAGCDFGFPISSFYEHTKQWLKNEKFNSKSYKLQLSSKLGAHGHG